MTPGGFQGASASAAPRQKVNMAPANKIFDRKLMLRIWRQHKNFKHDSVKDLHVSVRPGDKQGTPMGANRKPTGRSGRHNEDGPGDRSMFGSQGKKPAMKPSEGCYQVTQATTRDEILKRDVKSLLNKICPDNLKTIVERLANIELYTAPELDKVISIIFGNALAQPHYCETYCDMVCFLRDRYPEFPPENEGEKPLTFTRVLLNTVQNEFERLPTTFEPTEEDRATMKAEELNHEMKRRKDKMLANMKFIGNLFLRQLLAVKVVGQVVHDLIGIKDVLPEEHMIECVCELLQAIGHTLDNTAHGKILMTQFSARLIDLKRCVDSDGKLAFSKRIQFKTQDLLDLRSNNWVKKLFKEQAKTKDEVRKDAAKEAKQAARGHEVQFTSQVAGLRPTYIEEFKTAKPARSQKAPEAKPAWSQAYVTRLFQYYAGIIYGKERDADTLVADWSKAEPTGKNKREGLEWLMQIGFDDMQKEDAVAETIVVLLQKRCVDWSLMQESLSPFIEQLDDTRMDVPTAPNFAHSLFSRLLLGFGKDFKPSLLKVFTADQNQELNFSIFMGILKKVHQNQGEDGVRRILKDNNDFVDRMCKTKRIKRDELTSVLLQGDLGRHVL